MIAPLGAYCETAAANHEVSTKKCSCVCVCVCLSVSVCVCLSVCHADDVHHHPSVPSSAIRQMMHHLHLTHHPCQKVRRVNNAVLGIVNFIALNMYLLMISISEKKLIWMCGTAHYMKNNLSCETVMTV